MYICSFITVLIQFYIKHCICIIYYWVLIHLLINNFSYLKVFLPPTYSSFAREWTISNLLIMIMKKYQIIALEFVYHIHLQEENRWSFIHLILTLIWLIWLKRQDLYVRCKLDPTPQLYCTFSSAVKSWNQD